MRRLLFIPLLINSALYAISGTNCVKESLEVKEETPFINEVMAKAINGDAEAQFGIGMAYQHGLIGSNRDYKKAIQWFMKSAKQGNAKAQFNLAINYHLGLSLIHI